MNIVNFEIEEKMWREGRVLIGVDEAGRGPLAGPVIAAAVALLPISVIPASFAKASARRTKAGIQDLSDMTGFPVKLPVCPRAKRLVTNSSAELQFGSGMTEKERKIHFIIQSDLLKLGVTDSKKISPKKRDKIFEILTAGERVLWAVGMVDEKAIDKMNILQASLLAMRKAASQVAKKCRTAGLGDYAIYIDGRELIPRLVANQKAVIGGDAKIFSIAAASIIAKVARDRMMLKFAEKYPQYQFEKHKGYSTKLHYEMIKKHGLSPIHRKSFHCA